MDISIIGTGNIAWHLAMVLERCDYIIAEVYARNLHKAIEFASLFYDTKVCEDLDFSNSKSEVFFLCVSDDAILEICEKIKLPENAILVHTSGSKSLKSMSDSLAVNQFSKVHAGVFYPLMTFTKNKNVDFLNIPICIEANNEQTVDILVEIGKSISNEVYKISSEERLVLHVGAVFACNFTNHLWALSKEILESESLNFEMIKPLINETFEKAMKAGHPAEVQTGPALRNDLSTINGHLKYLDEDNDLKKVYLTMSESIKDWHND